MDWFLYDKGLRHERVKLVWCCKVMMNRKKIVYFDRIMGPEPALKDLLEILPRFMGLHRCTKFFVVDFR